MSIDENTKIDDRLKQRIIEKLNEEMHTVLGCDNKSIDKTSVIIDENRIKQEIIDEIHDRLITIMRSEWRNKGRDSIDYLEKENCLRIANLSTNNIEFFMKNLLNLKKAIIPKKLYRFRPILGNQFRYGNNPLSQIDQNYLSKIIYQSTTYSGLCNLLDTSQQEMLDLIKDSSIKNRENELSGEIYCCNPYFLNDPYDSLASLGNIRFVSTDSLDKFLKDDLSKLIREREFIACFGDFNDIRQAPISMWYHYAEDYYGCCFEYDTTHWDDNLKDALYPVTYQDLDYFNTLFSSIKLDKNDEESLGGFGCQPDYLYSFMLTKLSDWSCEKEWRIIADGKLLSNLGPDQFDPDGPKGAVDEFLKHYKTPFKNDNYNNTSEPLIKGVTIKKQVPIALKPLAVYFFDIKNLKKITNREREDTIFIAAQRQLIDFAKSHGINCYRLPIDFLSATKDLSDEEFKKYLDTKCKE